MSEMNFGRQLEPVLVIVTGDNKIDREYWAGRLRAFLEHQPCMVQTNPSPDFVSSFRIYPNANND